MKSADAKTREQLKELRDQLATKRGERTGLLTQRDAARDAFGDKANLADPNITSTEEFLNVENAQRDLGSCEDQINGLEQTERMLLSTLGSEAPVLHSNGNHSDQLLSHGWNGHSLLQASDNYSEAVNQGVFHSDAHFGTIVLGRICGRDDFAHFLRHTEAPGQTAAPTMPLPAAPAGPIGTHAAAVPPDYRGIQPVSLKPLSLLDIIPTGTTNSNIVEYVQVSAIPGSAAEVAEGALKPEEGLSFLDATAPVRTIAGWIKMMRPAMDDMAGLATLVNTLLPYDVRRRLEAQILNGDGVGQNLTGLLHTTGIASVAGEAGDTVADAILRGITTIVLSDQSPNFVTLNPVAWQDLAISKATGSGEYMFGYPGLYGSPSIWGLAVTQNRMIPADKPLVGDSTGATVLVREGVNLKTSDADQDDFIRNRVTVLAETRVAFPVWRPSAFCEVDLSGIAVP